MSVDVNRRESTNRHTVSLDVIAATVTKVVEGCVYLRSRYYAIFGMLSEGEFEFSALRSPLSAPLLSLLAVL